MLINGSLIHITSEPPEQITILFSSCVAKKGPFLAQKPGNYKTEDAGCYEALSSGNEHSIMRLTRLKHHF